jgi:hypothetical protein
MVPFSQRETHRLFPRGGLHHRYVKIILVDIRIADFKRNGRIFDWKKNRKGNKQKESEGQRAGIRAIRLFNKKKLGVSICLAWGGGAIPSGIYKKKKQKKKKEEKKKKGVQK